MRLLAFLWSGCWHEWEIIGKVDLFGDGFGNMTDLPTSRRYELQCKKCGDVKARKL